MKTTNSNIINAFEFLGSLNTVDVPIRLAFKISTMIERISTAMKPIEKIRNEIVNTNHEKDSDGKVIFIDPGKKYIKLTENGTAKLSELMQLETEIEFEQLTLDELELTKIVCKPAEMRFIAWLIK